MRRKFPTVFRSLFLAFICLIAMTGTVAQAQTPTDTIWVIETTDGNTYTGEILELGSTHLRIRTGIGELSLLRASVKSMKRLDSGMLKNGEYWPENPHASRHFWGPSGYGLRKGEGYYKIPGSSSTRPAMPFRIISPSAPDSFLCSSSASRQAYRFG